MRLRRSRKIWRVHEGHDFEATSQFQAAEREQTEPTKPHRFAEPVFYPDIERVHDPQSASARPMSRVRPITGTFTRDKFPMKGRRNLSSGGGTGSISRRANQGFSEDVLDSGRAQRNCANNKKDRSAYGSYLRNYADREKRQRQKFVEFADSALRMMQLCEARPVFLIAFLAAFLCLARRNFFARPKDML